MRWASERGRDRLSKIRKDERDDPRRERLVRVLAWLDADLGCECRGDLVKHLPKRAPRMVHEVKIDWHKS